MRASRPSIFFLLLLLAAVSAGGCSSGGSSEKPASTIDSGDSQAQILSFADVAATNEAAVAATEEYQAEALSAEQTASVQTATSRAMSNQTATVEADVVETDAVDTPQAPTITPSPSPPPTPSEPFDPTKILSVPVESIAYLPDNVVENSRDIFNRGRTLGRDGQAFSKLGDSLIANPHFLTGFDDQGLDLGVYDFLQPSIDHFTGSYERYGVAIHAGLHSWGIFDPMWADKNWCEPNESMVACEFRLNNPSVLLILLGSNDAGAPDSFAFNLRKLVEFSIENGVIPVLVTKADRFEGPENTNNIIIREIAAEFEIPLWDFDLLAGMIPGRGLKEDGIHLTPFDEFDYTLPQALDTGHGVHNLSALMILDGIRTQVMQLP